MFESKAQADEKAQHTWEYVSILKRLATQLSDIRWGFQTTSNQSFYLTRLQTNRIISALMKIRPVISLFITFAILACASKPIHSVTIFVIEGRVYDKESNFPLNQVKVYFIDTGYDKARSKKATPVEIGLSDSRGKIDLRFNYLWERKKSAFYTPAIKTFDIVLSREAYETKKLHFKESELETDRLAFLVNLEDVYLIRTLE
jgi:hypothetical protein